MPSFFMLCVWAVGDFSAVLQAGGPKIFHSMARDIKVQQTNGKIPNEGCLRPVARGNLRPDGWQRGFDGQQRESDAV